MKKILFLLIFIPFQLFATKHYVAVGGGGAGTLVSPFATLAQVNAHTFIAGDSILFNKGDVWRETLEVPNSGTAGSYIYFGAYGSGTNPRILGSKATTTWTNTSGSIWKTDITFTSPMTLYPASDYSGNGIDITFNVGGTERFGNRKSTSAGCVAEFDWAWVGNYIYVYAATNPASRYTGIEVPQRRFCVSTNDNQYLHFNGIDVAYCSDTGFDSNSDHDVSDVNGCILENCKMSFIGGITGEQFGYGCSLIYSDLIIRNCETSNCGRRGISLDIYANGFTASNALIEDNYLHDGFHTTGVDINVGAGGGYTANWDGVTIRRNRFYDPTTATIPSNQIFIQNSRIGVTTISNIYIYSNIFSYPPFSAINMEGSQSVYVYNNTFYEVGSITDNAGYQLWIDANNASVKVKNNIFYCTSVVRNYGHGAGIYCASTYANCDIDYNLYYRTSNSLDIIIAGSTYYMNTAFPISGKGWEAHGKKIDPSFVSTSDYHLQAGSQAIGAGVNVGLSLDFAGNAFSNPPAIGAYDINSESIPVTSITVFGAGGAITISTAHGTLQLHTIVLPTNATDTAKVWSIADGTGHATISSSGLVTAVTDGTVTATATAHDGSNIYDDLQLTISNQDVIPFSIVKRNGKIVQYKGKTVIRK